MLNNNKKAFSLVVAMFLMIVTSLLSLYLLEYIIPFSRNTKWMENWTKAYYQANKWIEDVLYSMKVNWNDPYYETWSTITSSWYSYSLISTWVTIPIAWDWTSEFDEDYNKISISNPVQLLLKWNIDNFDKIKFYFKVPHFDESSNTPIDFIGWNTPIINWQLSSENDTLNAASWSHILNSDINSSTWTINEINFDTFKEWETLWWTGLTMKAFFLDTSNNCFSSWCILKLSIINELKTDDTPPKKIPYLEYKIDFNEAGPWSLPLKVANYYAIIRTNWKSTWYRKDLKLYIPQQTTIEAFDFTVFQ